MSQGQVLISPKEELKQENLESVKMEGKKGPKIFKNQSQKPSQTQYFQNQAYKKTQSDPSKQIEEEETIQDIFDSQMSKLVDLVNSVLDNSFPNAVVAQQTGDKSTSIQKNDNDFPNSENSQQLAINFSLENDSTQNQEWEKQLSIVQIIVVKLFQEKKQKQEKKSKRVEEKQKMFFKKAFKYVENQYFSQKLQKKKIQKRFKDYDDFYTYFFQESAKENKMDITQFYHPQKTTAKIRAQGQRSFNQVYIDLLLTSYKFRQEVKNYLNDTFFQEITLERNQKIEKFLQKCFQKVENQIKNFQSQNNLQEFPKQTLKALFTPKYQQNTKNQIQIPEPIKKMIEDSLEEYIIKNPKSKIPWSVAELRETKDFAQNYIESFENQISQQRFTNSNFQLTTNIQNNDNLENDNFINQINSNTINSQLTHQYQPQSMQQPTIHTQNLNLNQNQNYNQNLTQTQNNAINLHFNVNSKQTNNQYFKSIQSQSTLSSIKHSNNNTTNTSFASSTANPDHFKSTEDSNINLQNQNQNQKQIQQQQQQQQNFLPSNNSSFFNNQFTAPDNSNAINNKYLINQYNSEQNSYQKNRNFEFQVPQNYQNQSNNIQNQHQQEQEQNYNQPQYDNQKPQNYQQYSNEFNSQTQNIQLSNQRQQQPLQNQQRLHQQQQEQCCNCQNNQQNFRHINSENFHNNIPQTNLYYQDNQNFLQQQQQTQLQQNQIHQIDDYKKQNIQRDQSLKLEYTNQPETYYQNPTNFNQINQNSNKNFLLKSEFQSHDLDYQTNLPNQLEKIIEQNSSDEKTNNISNLSNIKSASIFKQEAEQIEEEVVVEEQKAGEPLYQQQKYQQQLQQQQKQKQEDKEDEKNKQTKLQNSKEQSLKEKLKTQQQQEEEDQINHSQTNFQETIDKYFEQQQQLQLSQNHQEQEQHFNTYNSLSTRNQVRAIDQELPDLENEEIQIQNEEEEGEDGNNNQYMHNEENNSDLSDQDDYKDENEDNRIKIQRGKKIKIKSEDEDDKILPQVHSILPQDNNDNNQIIFNQDLYEYNPIRTDFSKPIRFNATFNQSYQERTEDGPQKSLFNLQSTSNIFKTQSQHYSQPSQQ